MNCDLTWTTADGKIIKISEMETDHIKRCIKILVNRSYSNNAVALMYSEDIDSYAEEPPETYLAMIAELKKRTKNNDHPF